MSALVATTALELIGSIFKPLTELIDNLHTSKEEKLDAKLKMFEAQSAFALKILDYEAKVVDLQGTIINSEAKSEHWLTSNWRPLTMITFLVMIVSDTYGWTASAIPEQVWTLLQLGLGGYVVGRSGEKIAESISSAIKAKKAE